MILFKLLIRDAAYDALPKAVRAELHRRFAEWLDRHGDGVVELDEIIGHHLEQAWRYRGELGLPDDTALRDAAHGRLVAAMGRAMVRNDYAAAATLADRALRLVPEGQIDHLLEVDRIDAVTFSRGMEAGLATAREAVDRARAAGDRVAELCAMLEVAIWTYFTNPHGALEQLDALARRALPELEASGDDCGLWLVFWAQSTVAYNRGRLAEQIMVMERSLTHARRLPSRRFRDWSLEGLAAARYQGPTPVPELIAWLEEHQSTTSGRSYRLALCRAGALAMAGAADEAQAIVATVRDELRERGRFTDLAMSAIPTSKVSRLAGDPERAERQLGEACEFWEEQRERSYLSTTAALRAAALLELDQPAGADTWAARADELAAPDDMVTQLPLGRVRALLASSRRDDGDAERLARAALDAALETDFLPQHGEAHETLAVVLARAGRSEEAAAAYERAAHTFARKGDVVSERRVRERLAAGAGLAARTRGLS